ncbi:ankyrin repeat-containing protein [Cordyceps javanica]|uniref:Ankyrin repeat-containing protein n=1 Tax=Cordyceps javanica TaxID=43265 RepID=A0A545VXW4_9HYPO|nr:ankyrin repeat-containing protein [Cordyceps javanica]TQW06544.1 ankyrin repeat-containing protein [Cordyceps javanica]
MATQFYETLAGSQVPDDMLVDAAKLFNENYGTWGEGSFKPGSPVRLSASRLRKEYLPDDSRSSYTRVVVDGVLAGHAFLCRWNHQGKTVCWVTQLVVRKEYRKRGLAGGLLTALREHSDDIFGIMSSHPAASSIEKVSLDFITKNALGVMQVSPITYIRDAKLCGTIFDGNDSTGLVSGVNTSFFVDHEEPLNALEIIRESLQWPLGDLPDGYEYLLIVPAKARRSRFRSSTGPSDVAVAEA